MNVEDDDDCDRGCVALTAGSASGRRHRPPRSRRRRPPARPHRPRRTQTPAEPAAPAPGAAAAAAAQPPRPFPKGAKMALDQPAGHRLQLGRRQGRDREDPGVRQEEDRGARRQAQGAQALQTKLQQGGSVLSDPARGQTEKDLQKMPRELQCVQEDAQPEQHRAAQELQSEFQTRLNPIIEQVAQRRGCTSSSSIADPVGLGEHRARHLRSRSSSGFDAGEAAPRRCRSRSNGPAIGSTCRSTSRRSSSACATGIRHRWSTR